MNRPQISYEILHDKIHGCWIGKTLGGTMGAPYEGIKMPMNLDFDPKMLDVMLPNDDLDLQLLWLDVIEKKGMNFTSRDLLKNFTERCAYSPGEYAVMRKNYLKGIYPPMSGTFCNDFYAEGMGSPIRSEIWACVFPGNPKMAADISVLDAQIDHKQASIDGERFFAALESAAFFENNLLKLVDIGLEHVTKDSKLYNAIVDSVEWSTTIESTRAVLNMIISKYGHPDCTNVFQNFGIIMLSLFHGEEDFIKTNMIAINSGFDTDCTAATVSSILGILNGANYFKKYADVEELKYVLGVDLKRDDTTIRALADEVTALACAFDDEYGLAAKIYDKPKLEKFEFSTEPMEITYFYEGLPSIDFDTPCNVSINIKNNQSYESTLTYMLKSQTGLTLFPNKGIFTLPPNGCAVIDTQVKIPKDSEVIMEKNLIDIQILKGKNIVMEDVFGVSGASVYKLSGPFWQTTPALTDEEIIAQPYFNYLAGKNRSENYDNIRNFHINFSVDSDLGREAEETLFDSFDVKQVGEDYISTTVSVHEDSFELSDFFGLQGKCVAYLTQMLYVPEHTECNIQIGHSDGLNLWLNDELVLEHNDVDFFTSENSHLADVKLKKGYNKIVLRLTRRSMKAKYSLVFSVEPTCADHIIAYGSGNPIYFESLSQDKDW